MSRYWKGQVVKFFVLGVPVYRLRHLIPCSLPTIERFYRVIRQAIYVSTLQELSCLEGTLELDETMFGGKIPGKRVGVLKANRSSLACIAETGIS